MKLIRILARLATVTAVAGASSLTMAAPASAVDIYTTPGKYTVNGRQWRTTCAPYSSQVTRCTTEIWATLTTVQSGKFVTTTGWVFNNLTYKSSSRSVWASFNPLITPGRHTVDGRYWLTECDTAKTGANTCRSMIWSSAVKVIDGKFTQVAQWNLNNIVHVTPLPCPVSQSFVRTVTGRPSLITSKCTVSKSNPNWVATQHSVPDSTGKYFIETIFFRKLSTGWSMEARSGLGASALCTWYKEAGVPLDLADTISYCFSG